MRKSSYRCLLRNLGSLRFGAKPFGCQYFKTVYHLGKFPPVAAAAVLAARRLAVRKSDDPLALIPLYLKESTAKAFVNKYAGKNFT